MKFTTRKIALCGIVAGLYAAVTILTASFSYGPVQFRLAEALAVLCCLEPSMVLGVTLGCFVSNVFSTVSALDMVVGTLATLFSCLTMTRCRRGWQTVLPNVLWNGTFVGAMLAWLSAPPGGFWPLFALNFAQVALGEAVVMCLLGVPLYSFLKRSDLLQQLLNP